MGVCLSCLSGNSNDDEYDENTSLLRRNQQQQNYQSDYLQEEELLKQQQRQQELSSIVNDLSDKLIDVATFLNGGGSNSITGASTNSNLNSNQINNGSNSGLLLSQTNQINENGNKDDEVKQFPYFYNEDDRKKVLEKTSKLSDDIKDSCKLSAGNISSQFVFDLLLNNERNTEYQHIIKSIGCSSKERGEEFIESNGIVPEKNYQVTPIVQSYEDLYKNPDIDVVYIGTPHTFHKEQSINCLNNSKHVLIEKPITVTKKDAEEIFKVAKKNNKFCMEAVWTRFFPSIEILKNKVYKEQVIGDVYRLFADLSYQCDVKQLPLSSRVRDKKLAAGSLLDIGIYPITYSRILLDDQVGSKASKFQQKSFLTIDEDDLVDHLCSIIIKYENGKQALLTSSELVDGPKSYVRLEGTKGWVEMYSDNPARAKHFKIFNKDGKEIYEYKDDSGYNGFIYEANAVANDIEAGKLENEVMPHDESLLVMGLMDEIRKDNGLNMEADNFYSQNRKSINGAIENKLIGDKNVTQSSVPGSNFTSPNNDNLNTFENKTHDDQDFENIIFTAQGKKKKPPKWTFTAGIFADKKQEIPKKPKPDCDKNVKFITTPVTVVNPGQNEEDDDFDEEEEYEPPTPKPKPRVYPKRPKPPPAKRPSYPYWMFDSSSDDPFTDEEESDFWSISDSDFSSSDDDSFSSKNLGKLWFLGFNSSDDVNDERVPFIPNQLLVSRVSENLPGLFMDQRNELIEYGDRLSEIWTSHSNNNISMVQTEEEISSDKSKAIEIEKRGKFLNRKYSKLRSTKFLNDGGKSLARNKYYWKSDYMKERAKYNKQKQRFKNQQNKFKELESETWTASSDDEECDEDNEYDFENQIYKRMDEIEYIYVTPPRIYSMSKITSNYTKIEKFEISENENDITYFTTQVINWDNEKDQETKLNLAKRNQIFQNQQLIMDHNLQEPSSEEIFVAQGSGFSKGSGKKAKGPKWHVGAGMYMNKDLNKGATIKETTFIPVKPVKKPTTIYKEVDKGENDDGSDSGSSSDEDGFDKNDDLKRKLMNRRKNKKKFSLFSVDDLIESVDEKEIENYNENDDGYEDSDFEFDDSIINKLVIKVIDNSTNITTFKYPEEEDEIYNMDNNDGLESNAIQLRYNLYILFWLIIAFAL
ncbi:hypothetical protein KGF54_004788 [Candida jiufengensis]|uniref:uncharacterized protein n=1 Tax=Candida jiufengensis TaxID=497108 RepID=UPI00222535BD|nr:uncharacterized protein KGF54_004788 [Candida jiufengensis]KAI5951713.1 hypothetical protein KGF54_004788 [Candida jiufengensis]